MAVVAVEGAELVAPELEVIGSKALGEIESLGSKLFSKTGEGTASRLFDVGTGVMLGQSLNSNKSSPQPTPAEGPGPTKGGGVRRRATTPKGGGCDCCEDDEKIGGGDGPRPLAEKMQIGILVVLLLVVIVVVIVISVKKPGDQISFWSGLLLGAITGGTIYWVSRSPRR